MAQILLETGCLEFSPSNPFTYASGATGPIYCDNRRLLGFPGPREEVVGFLVETIRTHGGMACDFLASVATGGIPWGAMVARELNLPFVYVRGKKKGHGKDSSVEGYFSPGGRALLVEDLVNQASSVAESALALRKVHIRVDTCLSLVNYEMPKAKERLNSLKLSLISLTDFSTLLEASSLSKQDKEVILSWYGGQGP